MNYFDYQTYQEIFTQTDAWIEAIERANSTPLPNLSEYSYALFTGCGSTYYLATALAVYFQSLTGLPAKAAPASELFLNSSTVITKRGLSTSKKTLLFAFSRSGTTTETIKAVERLKDIGNVDCIVISNYNKLLSTLANVNITIEAGQEKSVAQTRSFSSMYLAGVLSCARLAERNDLVAAVEKLPEVGNRLLLDYDRLARSFGENLALESFFFLGSGLLYGLACEISLKYKEMTLSSSEPFHFLEFRHGPMSMVNEKVGIVGLLSESNIHHESAVLSQMQELGGRVFSLGESGADVVFRSSLPEPVRGILYLPVLQLAAVYRAVKKGLNPDRPKNLSAVVKLEL